VVTPDLFNLRRDDFCQQTAFTFTCRSQSRIETTKTSDEGALAPALNEPFTVHLVVCFVTVKI